MSSDSHERTLVEKLNNMSNSQQSIQSLSLWVMYHVKKAKDSVNIWKKEILDAKPPARKLVYLYLANDVMQNSKKKTHEFVDAFQKVLPEVLQRIWEEISSKDKASINRMLDIWEQRKIFSSSFCASLKAITLAPSSKSSTKQRPPSSSHRGSPGGSTFGAVSRVMQQLEDLVNDNESNERSLKAIALHRQNFSTIMQESVKNEKLLESMSLDQLRKIQTEYDQYLKKYSDLKYALVKENDKRKEYVRALQEELKIQTSLQEQIDNVIKEWTSNNVQIQRYLTNIEININNKKLHDDVSHVGKHHPNSTGDGGYYFDDGGVEEEADSREYGNKKRHLSEIADSSNIRLTSRTSLIESVRGSSSDERDLHAKRQKIVHSEDLLIEQGPPPPQDVNSILNALSNNHSDDSTSFDSLMMNNSDPNNAFRLHDDEFNTNQFLYDRD